jgi:hypothetical protein
MVTCRRNLHLGLLLLVWTGLGGVAGAGCDPDPGLGGDPMDSGCVHLDLNDDFGGSECDGPIQVTGASSSGSTLDVGLSNPTNSFESGYLLVSVIMDDKLLTFAEEVAVPEKSSLYLQFAFPVRVTLVGVDACAQKPGGIVETPDPVAVTVLIPPEEVPGSDSDTE